VRDLLGRTPPYRMTDGREVAWRDWAEGYDPDTWLDRAINATRTEIFPFHGLDPLP
jgi:acetoin utilization protein AcuC